MAIAVRAVQDILEEWAPRDIAWERDNPGLQCGSLEAFVKGVLVTLDVSEEVIAEARRKRADLIVSHHPLLFRPLRSVDTREEAGKCLATMLGAGISLYSTHTNADFASGGTSFVLAEKLGLRDVAFLHCPYTLQKKIVTFVPADRVDTVAAAMADAGAGTIGKYDDCSFRLEGTGTFRGNEETHPAVGSAGRLERVNEVRLEMMAPGPKIKAILKALRGTHPYEEVAYDVYPTENLSIEYGMGTIGDLPRPRTLRTFIGHVKKSLGTPHVRFCGDGAQQVSRVAVCGGSGADLFEEAVRKGADAFVTADVRYHSFHDSRGRIALIDAGHYETEFPVISAIAEVLRQGLNRRRESVPVYESSLSTNPVQYV